MPHRRRTRSMPMTAREIRSHYPTEGALCDAFAGVAQAAGWEVFAEHAGYDLLLHRPTDGTTVGIEAKLCCSLEVVAQVLPPVHQRPGEGVHPHYLAVLVPLATRALTRVCTALRVGVLTDRHISPLVRPAFPLVHLWPAWRRPELPQIPLQSGGGRPSPGSMSPWRVKALRAVLHLEAQGHITRPELAELGLSPTIWVQRWLSPDGTTMGTRGRLVTRYVRRDHSPSFPSKGYEAELALLQAQQETS